MGMPEATSVMHAVISGPTSTLTGGDIYLSNFGENTATPLKQVYIDSEAMESELILESTHASVDGALLHLGITLVSNQPFLSRKKCLEQR